MDIEAGLDGLFVRVAARRAGYESGHPIFGNARAMENALAKMLTTGMGKSRLPCPSGEAATPDARSAFKLGHDHHFFQAPTRLGRAHTVGSLCG